MPFAPEVEVFDPMMDFPMPIGVVVDTMPFADPVSVVVKWPNGTEDVVPVKHLEEVGER